MPNCTVVNSDQQKMACYLPCGAPASALPPGVLGANGRRPSCLKKQKKASHLRQRNDRESSCSRARALPTGCARPFDWQPGGGGVLARSGPESGVQPLPTAPAAILIEAGSPAKCSPHSHPAEGPEVPGARPLHAAPASQ